jgi:tetratricopeptide (TPR) repeat protein
MNLILEYQTKGFAMKRAMRVLMITAVVGAGSAVSYAAGTGGGQMQSSNPEASGQVLSLYDQGVVADKREDYQEAVSLFEKALQADPDNADILNMLAHSQRKMGLVDEAITNYKKALKIRPDFVEAREYLGEAYIDAALKEIKTLKSYGDKGEENLEDLTKDLKDAASKL